MNHNPISIAPMIGWTDRNFRYLFRHISSHALLYTEMVMDTSLIYNTHQLDDFIGYDRLIEPPLAIQLGGNNPDILGKAVEIVESYGGYHEINLNCGCPSNKAKKIGFGAELMLEHELVRQILTNMKRHTSSLDISVKCRIGTNKRNAWDDLVSFVRMCSDCGVTKMVIHARICILCGLSPAQNRTIPPLRYDVVHRLVDMFPTIEFILNGGIQSDEEIASHIFTNQYDDILQQQQQQQQDYNDDYNKRMNLINDVFDPILSNPYQPCYKISPNISSIHTMPIEYCCQEGTTDDDILKQQQPLRNNNFTDLHSHIPPVPPLSQQSQLQSQQQYYYPLVHGVMIGREAYHHPWKWANIDHMYYQKQNPGLSRRQVLERYLDYIELAQDDIGRFRNSIASLSKPLHNFFHGCPTNRLYKQKLDQLIKDYSNITNIKHQVPCKSSSYLTMRDMIIETVGDTISERFLDEFMGPDGIMISS